MVNPLKNNGYRILGLDISASQKEILKRYKEIINRLKIDDQPEYDLDFKVGKTLRNETSVNNALKSLQSPKDNFREYFFWFQTNSKSEELTFKHIAEGEIDKAIDNWKKLVRKAQNLSSYFYKKNLAIFYSLLLFEEDNDEYLNESIKLWHEITNSDKFWEGLFKKYRQQNEITANLEALDNFKKNIINNLSEIYSDLYKLHKENKYLKKFREIFETYGKKTEKNLSKQTYNVLLNQLEELQKFNERNNKGIGEKDLESINGIIKSIQFELVNLKKIGLYENNETKIIRDHLSESIRLIGVKLHNDAEEFQEAVNLIKISIDLCGTDSLRARLKSELKIIKENPANKCWFCGLFLKKGEEENFLHEAWYKVVDRESQFFGGDKVRFNKFDLITPRCKKCSEIHGKREYYNGIRIFLGVAVGIGLVFILPFIISLLLGIATYFILKGINFPKIEKNDVKNKREREEYPPYKELEREGWSKGEEPSN